MPIDKTFRETWRKIGQHNGHAVWQSEPDESSRIHGDIVGVDFNLCYGCEKCITACPTNVFATVEAINIQGEGGSQDTLESLLQSGE